ncbi:alpha/beta fold hydrolase [Azospirillum sp. sgz301742]
MTPVVFEGCFGWLHPAAGRRGVVLCSPHGNEELCVHRTWRTLAERLAEAGLPTLRFDYPGAGNSAGGDEDPERVRAWLDGIHAAIRQLRASTGVQEVALVGLRLGATLAAMAAAERGGVERLVLMAPCASGKAYAHEVKAMARLAGTPQTQADAVEFAGFLLTAETLAALRALDLAGLPAAPAGRVLLLNRTDVREGGRLADRLRALGAAVEEEPFTDLAALMNSVHRAMLPEVPLARVTEWLSADMPAGETAGTPPAPARIPPAMLEVPGAVETPVLFGPGGSLAGILCEPATRTGPDRPALLLLNSGATHHVGSGRMSVMLARRLAARGFASLRMDIAGLGDSAPRAGRCDNLIYCEDSRGDTRAALDWLQARGYARVVSIGLCAGATLALHTALGDPRVVGQVLVNPGRFFLGRGETSEAVIQAAAKRTRDYVQMMADPRAWRAVLRNDRKVARVARTLTRRALDVLRVTVQRVRGRVLGTGHAAGDVAQWFRRLSERGVDTLLLYSADDITLGELESRLGRGAKRLSGLTALRLETLEGADHSLMLRTAQERFAALLEAHLTTAFTAGTERSRYRESAGSPARTFGL